MIEKNIIIANIENLTSLWKTASIPFKSYHSEILFNYCLIENSDWPNKLWLNKDFSNKDIPLLKEKIVSISSSLTIPYFNYHNNILYEKLESEGFVPKFEQVGMSLKLNGFFKINNNVNLRLVSNKSEAQVWSNLFEMAFGYKIHPNILLKTWNKINYYLAFSYEEAVGTAISYKTKNVMGIHSVGIPPKMRRKGFAEQIMKLLINASIENDCNFITLQASDMGKNMYLKLGFSEDFKIINYNLQ